MLGETEYSQLRRPCKQRYRRIEYEAREMASAGEWSSQSKGKETAAYKTLSPMNDTGQRHCFGMPD